MIHSTSILKRDHHLLYTNFTKSNTMEGNRAGSLPTQGAKSLADLKKEMTELTIKESMLVEGGRDLFMTNVIHNSNTDMIRKMERERWNNACGGIVPQ